MALAPVAWLKRMLGRGGTTTDADGLDGGAIIMAVDYQRRGSNFDLGGKRYGIDRTMLSVDGIDIPYAQVRALRLNRSHVGGLLGRFSLPGMVLIALGLMPAKRMQSIMRAEIVAGDGRIHAVSSMSARGFGKMPVNQLDAFRWFLACLVHRLPAECTLSVGSWGGFAGGIFLALLALPLAVLGALILAEQQWWLGGSLATMAVGGAWVGVLMIRNGARRRVDAAGLLAYVGRD
jgi:hypothetical protein